jgi:hypothetical protein
MGLRFVPVGENLGRLESDYEPTPPTADAGVNAIVWAGVPVTLDGSGSSDVRGRSLTYLWEQISGTAVTFDDATLESPTFTSPAEAATLVFILTVNNGFCDSSTDSVVINVTAP